MKRIDLTPKPFSKAEKAYLKKVEENRGKEFIQIKNLDSMAKKKAAEHEERSHGVQMNYFTPEYIKNWITNS